MIVPVKLFNIVGFLSFIYGNIMKQKINVYIITKEAECVLNEF